jgi:hypothetical protein
VVGAETVVGLVVVPIRTAAIVNGIVAVAVIVLAIVRCDGCGAGVVLARRRAVRILVRWWRLVARRQCWEVDRGEHLMRFVDAGRRRDKGAAGEEKEEERTRRGRPAEWRAEPARRSRAACARRSVPCDDVGQQPLSTALIGGSRWHRERRRAEMRAQLQVRAQRVALVRIAGQTVLNGGVRIECC